MNVKPSVQAFAVALRKLVEAAAKDGGKSYDELAARIKAREADALIEEAIGYVPEGLESVPQGDSFKIPHHHGREGKRKSRMEGYSCPLVDKIQPSGNAEG